MKKLTSIILTLLLLCSLIPMAAFAETTTAEGPSTGISSRKDGEKDKKPDSGKKDDDKKGVNDWKDRDHPHKKKGHGHRPQPHNHEYNGYGSNPTYHWLQCACGCKINVEPHVDPLDTDDDYCICGYHFSDNAQLVTLWLKDCKELKNFRKDVYEYETDAHTYKDVNELKRIATRTFDSEATVELPEDLTLKEGENKIEIKVTAENKKVTKVYTVIVNKEAKK